ncbi:MAG: hypothetical protein ABI629_16070 [bacterium]
MPSAPNSSRRVNAGAAAVSAVRRVDWRSWLPFAVVVLGASLVAWPPVQHPEMPIKIFPDSGSYLSWGYGRPPTGFFFYTLVGSGRPALIAQTLLSIASWSAFGWLALGLPGAIAAAALVMALPVSIWNYAVLSESITLSLGAAVCAASIALGRRWSAPRFIAWLVAAVLFTGVRAENFFLVPPLLLALLAHHRRHWLALLAAGALCAALFVTFSVVADKENRNWQIRMTNLVLTRIRPERELRAQFEALGMPSGPELDGWHGHMLAAYDPAFAPATPEFQHWLDTQSRPTYLRWLATAEPHRQLAKWLDFSLLRRDDAFNYYAGGLRLPRAATATFPFWDALRVPFKFWWVLAALPLAASLAMRRITFAQSFALAYLAAVYALTFVVFHADTGELERHLALVGALYRMAPLVMLGSVWSAGRAAMHRRSCAPAS